MLDNIYRSFKISITPEVITKEDDEYSRTTVDTQIEIVDIETGKYWSGLLSKRITDNVIESIILKRFPETWAAEEIRSIRDLDTVELVKDLSPNMVAEGIHTALRKLCSTTASKYWWNLIHILPSGVMSRVWVATTNALKKVDPISAPIYQYVEATKKAWETTFGKLVYATSMFEKGNFYNADLDEILSEEEAKEFKSLFEDMSNKDFKAYTIAVRMAQLSLDYLENDWSDMLGYIVSFP
jgi:hypothetical protein